VQRAAWAPPSAGPCCNPAIGRAGIIRTRYRGDRAKEKEYFDTFKMALEPDDVARCISFALAQPCSVQIAQLVVLPVNRW
jgi:NADP-dependent 3-hydroxy acid dehydrogenase YdfG